MGSQWFLVCVRVQYPQHTVAHNFVSCRVALVGYPSGCIVLMWISTLTIETLFKLLHSCVLSQVDTTHIKSYMGNESRIEQKLYKSSVAALFTLQNCWVFSELLSFLLFPSDQIFFLEQIYPHFISVINRQWLGSIYLTPANNWWSKRDHWRPEWKVRVWLYG